MAALCQRPPWQQLSHLASPPGTPVRSLPTGPISVQTETIISHLRLRANSNSREADSPFTEKSSVKRVRGGGNATGVALKSLELWSADQARLRGSDDSAATSGSVFSEFRDPLQGQPGTILQVSVFFLQAVANYFLQLVSGSWHHNWMNTQKLGSLEISVRFQVHCTFLELGNGMVGSRNYQ